MIIGADTYSNVIELFKNNSHKVDNETINQFNKAYNMIEKIEKEKFNFEDIRKLCHLYNSYLDDSKEVIFSNINLYKNITEVGLELIKEYEEDGMVSELEEMFDMNKEQILELFSNIKDNPFMKRKITELLNNSIEL